MIEQFKAGLSAFGFAERAYGLLDAIHDDEYHTRSDPEVKALVEEIIPIATFAKCFEAPERHATIVYTGDTERYDAVMTVTGKTVELGHILPTYYIEVTSAVAPYEYLQREALSRHGSVSGGPNIRRIGKRADGTADVESKPLARHAPDARWDAINWINTAIKKKSAKDYPDPCVLIVRVQTDFIPSLDDWDLLVKESRKSARASDFAASVLVDTSRSELFHLG